MSSESAPRPIVGSQRFRVINSICMELSRRLEKKPEDFFTVFHARLSQVIDTSVDGQSKTQQAELWKPVVDAALFPKGRSGIVAGTPALLVFLDRDKSEYKSVLDCLVAKGIPYIFSTEEALLRKEEPHFSAEFMTPAEVGSTPKGKPFNRSEVKILSAIAAAILREEYDTEVLLTGQTVLNAFTEFSGYSHDQHRNQTDSDLLLCTAPPVSIPLIAIEIDGPHHFSEEHWFSKVGSAQEAKKKLARERDKAKEKDRALQNEGIPVLHIRVDNSKKSVLDRHTDTLSRLIGTFVDTINDQGQARTKKFSYLNSIAEQFSNAREKAYSTHPELEDLVYIAPELISWLLRNLKDLDEQVRTLQAQLDAIYINQPPGTPEEAYGYPLAAQDELMQLQEFDLDQLFDKLTCSIDWPTERAGATDSINVSIYYHSTIGAPLQLATFKETIPWLEVGGHSADHFNQLLRKELATMLGQSYYRRLELAEKKSWKSKILESLSSDTNLAEQEFEIRKLRDEYRSMGLRAIQKEINRRLRMQILRQMAQRGYLNDRFRPRINRLEALLERLVWIHETTPRPAHWDPDGELQDISLEKLLVTFPELDEMTQEAILRRFHDFIHSRLELYRRIPLHEGDWEALDEHINDLQHALETGAPALPDAEG